VGDAAGRTVAVVRGVPGASPPPLQPTPTSASIRKAARRKYVVEETLIA
jgi:hypothetical protein